MSTAIPHWLTSCVSANEHEGIDRWWNELDAASRVELASFEDSSFEELPLELYGHFVDPEDAREDEMWHLDLIEYLNAHPDIDFFLEGQTFHVCRAHREARRVLQDGRIAYNFSCPFARSACPFARALALRPGWAIKLSTKRAAIEPTKRLLR